MAYRLGGYLCLTSMVGTAFACGGSVDAGKISSNSAFGGSSGSNSATAGWAAHDASAAQAPVGANNQFIPITEADLQTLTSVACTGAGYECEFTPFVTEVVVDLGQEMARLVPPTQESNWGLTQAALGILINQSPAASIGISFFPNRQTQSNPNSALPASYCIDTSSDVPIATLGGQGSAQYTAIVNALAAASPIASAGTPIHDALRLARTNMDAQAASLFGQRMIILVTDGAPTLSLGCVGTGLPEDPVSTDPIIDEVKAAKAAGIMTMIVGTPGSAMTLGSQDARPWLSQAARAGGTSPCDCSDQGPNYCHIDMTQSTDISERAQYAYTGYAPACRALCTLPVMPADGREMDRSAVSVVYTSKDGTSLIRENLDDDCQFGWHFSADGTQVVICPETCKAINCDPTASTSFMAGCKAPIGIE